MSLDREEDRLLAQALADALDQDLTEVPSKEKLQQSHQFSRKFEKKIRAFIKESEKEHSARLRQRGWGSLARRCGALAAAFVCVLGLGLAARFSGGFLPKGSSDGAAMEDSIEQSAADFAASEEIAEDDAKAYADTTEAPTEEEASAETGTGSVDEDLPPAPDWQEQILAESARADEIASWSFVQLCEDGIFELLTEVQPVTAEMPTVHLSEIYEVYYQDGKSWLRVYEGPRHMQTIRGDATGGWMDGYELAQYGMARPGIYRLVRQVNQYRQALDIVITGAN